MRWATSEFVVGANLPWQRYGGDFGASAWSPDGGVGEPARRLHLREVLAPLSGSGISMIRWFMLCDGRAGLLEDPGAGPLGLDPFVFRDVDAALEELDRAGLQAILVLFDFHWFKPARVIDGVQTGGRSSFAIDPLKRSLLLESVVLPILERYGRHPAVAAWDVINEPEWATRPTRLVPWGSKAARPVMRAFIGEVVDLIHRSTVHAATVGSASTRSLSLVQGLGLDLYQAHWYDTLDRRAPLERAVAGFGLECPLLLGEFPTRASARDPAGILATARTSGYAGALSWSILSADEWSDHTRFVEALSTTRSADGTGDLVS